MKIAQGVENTFDDLRVELTVHSLRRFWFSGIVWGVVIAVPDFGNEVKNGYFQAKIEGKTYRKTA